LWSAQRQLDAGYVALAATARERLNTPAFLAPVGRAWRAVYDASHAKVRPARVRGCMRALQKCASVHVGALCRPAASRVRLRMFAALPPRLSRHLTCGMPGPRQETLCLRRVRTRVQ